MWAAGGVVDAKALTLELDLRAGDFKRRAIKAPYLVKRLQALAGRFDAAVGTHACRVAAAPRHLYVHVCVRAVEQEKLVKEDFARPGLVCDL